MTAKRRYTHSKSHDNSLKNLTHEGRPSLWDERKKPHTISLTDVAWEALQVKAKKHRVSLSEFLERYSREWIGYD